MSIATEPEVTTSAIDAVLADPESIGIVFQPVVDLARAVTVGYEALVRFPGGAGTPPPPFWFDAAREHGRAAELEAVVLNRHLSARPRLPENCFLSVNVAPDTVGSDEVQAVLAKPATLAATLIEITEQAPVEDYDALHGSLAVAMDRGAHLAVDDAGAGYASLNHVMQLRPSFLKLDRWLVTDCDRDPAKRAALEMLGGLANHIDAWVIAEGIERQGELEVLLDLRIPLGQGFFLARPAPEMTALAPEPAATIAGSNAARRAQAGISALVEPVPAVSADQPAGAAIAFMTDPAITVVVLVDERERPVGIVDRHRVARRREPREVTIVAVDDEPTDVLRRALSRPEEVRFDPLVCRNGRGAYTGIVRLERLIWHQLDSAGA